MAGTIGKTYNIKTVSLIIGGRSISGYGDGGGITFDRDADFFESSVGADGEHVMSRINNDNLTVTITLKETAKGYRDLAALMQSQLLVVDLGGPIVPLSFLMVDPLNGDSVSALYVTFLGPPTPSKANVAGEREFTLVLTKAVVTYGLLNIA